MFVGRRAAQRISGRSWCAWRGASAEGRGRSVTPLRPPLPYPLPLRYFTLRLELEPSSTDRYGLLYHFPHTLSFIQTTVHLTHRRRDA